jgi:hypothetical protein
MKRQTTPESPLQFSEEFVGNAAVIFRAEVEGIVSKARHLARSERAKQDLAQPTSQPGAAALDFKLRSPSNGKQR